MKRNETNIKTYCIIMIIQGTRTKTGGPKKKEDIRIWERKRNKCETVQKPAVLPWSPKKSESKEQKNLKKGEGLEQKNEAKGNENYCITVNKIRLLAIMK